MVVRNIRYTHIIVLIFVLCPIAALPFLQPTGVMSRTATDLYGIALLLFIGIVFFLPSKEININAADILFGCFLMIGCIKPTGLQFDVFLCVKNMSLMIGYIAFRMFPDRAVAGLFLLLVVGCLIQSVYGFAQYMEFAESLHPMFRLTGSFLNPAHLAFFLSMGTTITAAMLLLPEQYFGHFPFGTKWLFQVFALVATIWLAFVLAITESRAAWVGTILAVALLVYMRYIRSNNRWRLPKYLRAAVVAMALCIFCVSGYVMYHYKKDSADGRLLIWKITCKMIENRPITGNGAGAFRSDYLYAQAAYFAEHPDAPERMLAGNTFRPFNEYLRILYEHGLVGLLLITLSVYLAIRSSDSPVLKAVLTSIATICIFSYPLEIWCIKVYWLVALALAAKNLRPLRTVRCNFRIQSVYAVFWCATVMMTLFYADHTRGCIQAVQENSEDKEEIFAASYSVLHSNHEYLAMYARFLRREGNIETALKQMEALARLQPSSSLFCNIGNLHFKERRYAEAERCYLLARNMTPAAFAPLQQLMTLYMETGQKDKVRTVAEIIVEQPVKVKTNVTDRIKKEANEFLSNF